MMIEADILDRLCPGDHVCLIVDDDATWMSSLVTYIRAGLRDNHRILYYGALAEDIEAQLTAHGYDAAVALGSGQLQMATPEATYLASGVFDPETMIEAWRAESGLALNAGYSGLRAIGDMSWASRPLPGADQLTWYEENVNRVFADGYAMALCLYDRRAFSEEILRRVGCSHPATIESDTDPAAVPLLRTVRTAHPPGVRLEGEADLSNCRAFQAVLEHLYDDTTTADEPLTVDTSELRFADSAAARVLVQAAATIGHPLRIVGCTPTLQRLLVFHGAAAVRDLVVEPTT